MLSRRSIVACVAAGAALLVAAGSASAVTYPPDYSAPGQAWNVLPPGEAGTNPPGANSFSQVPLYDGLTPNFDTVTDASLPVFFKKNVFGLGGESPASTFSPPGHPGVVIERDARGVAHITGTTRADSMFGIGFVSYQDRVLLMEQLRGPSRLAAIDAPGINPFAILSAGGSFTPSAQTENFLASQIPLLQSLGPDGQQIVDDVDSYVAGINLAHTGVPTPAWTRNDVIAIASLLAARFGRGGGDEARRAQFLSGLTDRLGKVPGRNVFDDLRGQNDDEAPVTIDKKFKLGGDGEGTSGNVIIDAGSLDTSGASSAAASQASQASSSNALLVGAERSTSGHPLFVAGPQVGYGYPGLLFEIRRPRRRHRRARRLVPRLRPVCRTRSWPGLLVERDIVRHGHHRPVRRDALWRQRHEVRVQRRLPRHDGFSAGTLVPAAGQPARAVAFRETVHGPVAGYATVGGRRVAISTDRSTRGREMVSSLGFEAFNTDVDSPSTFIDAASKIELSFNWYYADKDNIAFFSSGLVPVRDGGVNRGLPTGGHRQARVARLRRRPKNHPQAINPPGGQDRQLEQQARERTGPRLTTNGRTARCTGSIC